MFAFLQNIPSVTVVPTQLNSTASLESPRRSYVPRSTLIPSVLPPIPPNIPRGNITVDVALQNSPSARRTIIVSEPVVEPPSLNTTATTTTLNESLLPENNPNSSNETNISINSRRRLQGLVLRPLSSRNNNNNDEHDISSIPSIPQESSIEPILHTTLYQNSRNTDEHIPTSGDTAVIVELNPIISERINSAIESTISDSSSIVLQPNEQIDTISMVPTETDTQPITNEDNNYRSELIIPTIITNTDDQAQNTALHVLHVEIPLISHTSMKEEEVKVNDDNDNVPPVDENIPEQVISDEQPAIFPEEVTAENIDTANVPVEILKEESKTEEEEIENKFIPISSTQISEVEPTETVPVVSAPIGRNRSNSKSSIRSTGSSSSNIREGNTVSTKMHEIGKLPPWYKQRNEDIKQKDTDNNNNNKRPPSRESTRSISTNSNKGTNSRRISTSSSASTASRSSIIPSSKE